MSREVPWGRLTAEAVVVVGSILLAFAIDAGWERNRLLDEERGVLLALQQELEEVDRVADETRESTVAARGHLLAFLEATPDEVARIPRSEIAERVYYPLIRQWGAAIPRGALDASTGSGQLTGVREPALRAALARLSSRMAHVDEIRGLIGELDIGTAAILGEYDGLYNQPGGFQRVEPETLRAIRDDPRIRGAASAKFGFIGGSLEILAELERSVDETLLLIDEALRR